MLYVKECFKVAISNGIVSQHEWYVCTVTIVTWWCLWLGKINWYVVCMCVVTMVTGNMICAWCVCVCVVTMACALVWVCGKHNMCMVCVCVAYTLCVIIIVSCDSAVQSDWLKVMWLNHWLFSILTGQVLTAESLQAILREHLAYLSGREYDELLS